MSNNCDETKCSGDCSTDEDEVGEVKPFADLNKLLIGLN